MGTTDSEKMLEGMTDAKPQAQHRWLEQLVGEWTFVSECPAAPVGTAQQFAGVESVRSLGGLWIVAEGRGEMPGGGEGQMLMTLGYDPQRGRYVGSWCGSMMTHFWVYDGELDADERVLTLYAEGPACDAQGNVTDKPAKFKDVIERISADERTLTGHMLGEDGQWQQLMTARYRRTK
ncbi:MAG: DUF1579 domain-containing protein [Phycisphaeraceae bacterium]